MSRATLLARRSTAHRGLLSLISVLVAVMTATLAITVGWTQASATDAAREGLGQTIQISAVNPDDPDDQKVLDSIVRSTIADVLDGIPHDVAYETSGGPAPEALWTVSPDHTAINPSDLPRLGSLSTDVEDALTEVLADTEGVPGGVSISGDLDATASALSDSLRASDAVALIPMGILALVGLVALTQIARLLAATREGEVNLLVSRGASPKTVTVAAVVEAAVVAIPAALAGAAAAWGILQILARSGTGAAAPVGTPIWTGVAVAIATVAALGVVAGLRARASVRRRIADRSGRTRQVVALGTVVLITLGAVVTAVQLRRYGSPLVHTPSGIRTDPLAAVAPALILAACAVLAMVVLGPAARWWAGIAGRSTGAIAPLAARQVARQLPMYVVPVVLLVLAGGSITLAGTYSGTAERLRSDVDVLAGGTDVRVTASGPGALDPTPFLDLDGASSAAPVLADSAYAEDQQVTMLGLAAADVPQVMRTPRSDDVDPGEMAASLAGDPFGDAPEIAPDAANVTVRVTVKTPGAPSSDLAMSLVLATPSGEVSQLPLGTLATTRPNELSAEVPPPPADEAWRIVAFDIDIPGAGHDSDATVSIDEVTVDDAALNHEALTSSPSMDGPDGTSVEGTTASIPIRVGDGASQLRLLTTPDSPPVPIIGTDALLDHLGMGTGDTFELTLEGRTLPVTVVGAADVVPGALEQHVAFVERGALAASSLRDAKSPRLTSEVWIAAGPPGSPPSASAVDRVADAAYEATSAAGDRLTVTASDSARYDATTPGRMAFWFAAGGTILLALAGVFAVAVASLRDRRGEALVLRAAGLAPRSLGRIRFVELAAVGVAALGVGVIAGWLVGRGIVSDLAAATITGVGLVPAPHLDVAQTWSAAFLVVTALGLLLVAGGVALRATAQTRDTTYREEVR